MKKTFEFQETVTYIHEIEVEVDEEREEDFEVFADEVADRVNNDNGYNINKDDIVDDFIKRYGDRAVFIEDGSPDVELEVI